MKLLILKLEFQNNETQNICNMEKNHLSFLSFRNKKLVDLSISLVFINFDTININNIAYPLTE